MRSLWHGIVSQWRLLLGSRLGLCLLALFSVTALVTGAIYDRLVLRDLPVVVVDLDGTHLTRLFSQYLDATPEIAVERSPQGALDVARAQLERGEVTGYVVFPHGFTERLKQ